MPILIPVEQSSDSLRDILARSQADSIVVSAGVVSEDDLDRIYPKLKVVISVVQTTSRDLDFAAGSKPGSNVAQ